MKPDEKKNKHFYYLSVLCSISPNISTNAPKRLLSAVLKFVKWLGKQTKSVRFSVKQHMWCDHWLTGHVSARHFLKKTRLDFFPQVFHLEQHVISAGEIVSIIAGCKAVILFLILDIVQKTRITLQLFFLPRKSAVSEVCASKPSHTKEQNKNSMNIVCEAPRRRVGSVSWVPHTSSVKVGEDLTKTTMPFQPLSSHPEHRAAAAA